jgi:hypothetical protein
VVDRIATLQEIETHWSWLDLQLANEALDIRSEADVLVAERREGNR